MFECKTKLDRIKVSAYDDIDRVVKELLEGEISTADALDDISAVIRDVDECRVVYRKYYREYY